HTRTTRRARQSLPTRRSSDLMTSATEAMLYLREAWAYAKLGRPSAFRRTAEKASAVFDDADRTGDPYWIHYFDAAELTGTIGGRDRKSTRLNSSHVKISYAVD